MRTYSVLLTMAAVLAQTGTCSNAFAQQEGAPPADTLISAVSPPDLLAVIEQFGNAVMTQQAGQDPFIVVTLPKYRYGVFLFDCQRDFGPCSSIDYRAHFSIPSFGAKECNAWNSSKRFVFCAVDEKGDLHLQLNVDLSKGLTHRGLTEYTSLWHAALSHFDRYFE